MFEPSYNPSGAGNITIDGKTYKQGSPEYYAALDAQKVHDASVDGQAVGTAQGAATRAAYSAQYPGFEQNQPPAGASPIYGSSFDATGSRSSGGGGGGSSSGGSPIRIVGADPAAALARLSGEAANMNNPLQPFTGATEPPPQVTGSGPADDTAARANIFARTKDNAAQTASASLNGLTEALGSRGLQGGGYEAGSVGSTLAREANTIGEVDRQQAESDLGRADSVADRNYQGQVAQRGQDISAISAQNSAVLADKQVQLQQRQASLDGLMMALKGATTTY